jgi:hypothetical protein
MDRSTRRQQTDSGLTRASSRHPVPGALRCHTTSSSAGNYQRENGERALRGQGDADLFPLLVDGAEGEDQVFQLPAVRHGEQHRQVCPRAGQ